uniref:Exoribonuclease phosphorolytic domain-containing protein n=1 Tax=Strigamia maritima TaxID=126957 RepID=T1J3I6_STRMM
MDVLTVNNIIFFLIVLQCDKVGTQAKGSAYIEMNKTKVICSVYGPRQIPKKQDISINGLLTCELKFAPFSCRQRRQYQQDNEEKELSLLLKQALESAICMHTFPNASLDVYVSVLENDGSALAAAITCAGLAIADSGIDMYDSIIGSSLKQNGDYTLLDPTYDEEMLKCDSSHGLVTIGYMPNKQQITAIQQSGILKQSTLENAVTNLIEACNRIYPLVKDCLVKSFLKQDN